MFGHLPETNKTDARRRPLALIDTRTTTSLSMMMMIMASLLLLQLLPTADAKPNIIIMQGDDLEYLEGWNAVPAHVRNNNKVTRPPLNQVPNIERLRNDGLEMLQAHTASPMCGTSRFSTITGRYPSRSSYGRHWDVINDNEIRNVAIMMTRLIDMPTNKVGDTQDCTKGNIAVTFKENGYTTGIVGKWHLFDDKNPQWNYRTMQRGIYDCGFDFAEALYPHNFGEEWANSINYRLEHNMEWVASEGIRFMEQNIRAGKPFFLYVNPTIPHPTSSVGDALFRANCRQTTNGVLGQRPNIPYGAPPEYGKDNDCRQYRRSVAERAQGDRARGMVWVDDSVGWMLATLEAHGELDNTIFLFQQDHGMEIKGGIYEQSTRIAQFVHYPNGIRKGTKFDGLVSTIDIGATMMDYAGINPTYEMDGYSWKSAIENPGLVQRWKDRCLYFENGYERSVKCGCWVHWRLDKRNRDEFWYTRDKASEYGLSLSNGDDQMFNVCDNNGNWVSSPDLTRQTNGAALLKSSQYPILKGLLNCHLQRTDPRVYTPDYDKYCGDLDTGGGGGPEPTPRPTPSPVSVSTPSPVNQPPPPSSVSLICLNQKEGEWSEHRAIALRYGGDLLSVPNRRIRNRSRRLAVRNGPPGAWIGLNDETSEGTFRWSDGKPVTFLDFPPVNRNTQNWDCVYLRPYRQWRWTSTRCSLMAVKGLYRLPSNRYCDLDNAGDTSNLKCIQETNGRAYSENCRRRHLGDQNNSTVQVTEQQYLRSTNMNVTQSQRWL